MALALKPGLVWGDDYKSLVRHCKENKYALPAVNVVGTSAANAVLEAAAANKSDVVIQLSNGGAKFFAGAGMSDSHMAMVLGAVSAARHVALLAEHYGVCVILHTDHANRKLVPWVEDMVGWSERSFAETGRPLFSSHMLDLSEESVAENLATSAEMLSRMAPLGMALEIELGVTGGEEDGVGTDIDELDNSKLYTQPSEVLEAYEKLKDIGQFSVAAAFGNVHGVYKPGNVKLRPEILQSSQATVAERYGLSENPLDLVFHGGSGSDLADIHAAIDYGVFKMNIDTDTQFAFAQSVGDYVKKKPAAFEYQIDPDTAEPYKSVYDPRKWLREGERGMVARLTEAFGDLKATGKSVAQG